MTLNEFNERVRHQGIPDRMIGKWSIIDIHEIPNPLLERHEIDFYCCNGSKVYLLRLRNRETKMFDISRNTKPLEYPDYLIAELPLEQIDDEVIANILDEFEELYNI